MPDPRLTQATFAERVDTIHEAMAELYGNGDVRFDSDTPRRDALAALDGIVAEFEHAEREIEHLRGDLAVVKREKSILMRELSRFTNNA